MNKAELNMHGDQELHPDGMTLVDLPKISPKGVLTCFYAFSNSLPPIKAAKYKEVIADLEAAVQKDEQDI
jgi:hypothetical protein